MSDSNLLLTPDYLSRWVAAWGPETGLVSCPGIGTKPCNFGGSLECAFLNSNQARIQFAADSLDCGFAQGKTLFWNHAMLDAAGGIIALGSHLAEDVTATMIVHAQAKRVSLPQLLFAQPVGYRKLRQVWDRQLRWSRVRRDGFPLIFSGELLNGATVASLIFGLGKGSTPKMARAKVHAHMYGIISRRSLTCSPQLRGHCVTPSGDTISSQVGGLFSGRGCRWGMVLM